MTIEEPSTCKSLLQKVMIHDQQAWLTFTQLYGPLVYSWARRLGLQDADAADVSQNVFRSVARSIDKFSKDRANGKLRAWLWTITRNHVRKNHLAMAKSPVAKGGTDAWMHLEQTPDADGETSVLEDDHTNVQLARRAMEIVRSEFNANTWQSFWRMTVHGHTAAEIGTDLGMSESAVRQAKYRVLCRMRELLDGM